MISSELVNLLFSSFAKFVSKLTNREVKFEQIKSGEVMPVATLKINKFLEGATEAFDRPAVNMIGAFEPGKIYCLQVDLSASPGDFIDDVFKFLAEKDIQLIVIDQSMNFVSLPEGYEIVKKEG